MKTHYSVLFASLRKVIQEKVSIGLLLFDGSAALCKFSYPKIKGLKHLMQKDEFKIVSESVTALEQKLRQNHLNEAKAASTLFTITDPEFSLDYISYLSRYKNNLITYSTPKPIDIEVKEENVLKLFANLVGESQELAVEERVTPLNKLQNIYGDKISAHFIQNHVVGMDEIPNLLVPVKVDLAGRNNVDVFVQSIDMTTGEAKIIQEISTFYLLKDTYKKNGKKMYDFVLSEEPPISLRKQYELWKHLANSNEFNYVDISEGNKILEYAETHDVRPVFGDAPQMDEFPF
jgi:hypothetical protein